jgi:hypothetical protein
MYFPSLDDPPGVLAEIAAKTVSKLLEERADVGRNQLPA